MDFKVCKLPGRLQDFSACCYCNIINGYVAAVTITTDTLKHQCVARAWWNCGLRKLPLCSLIARLCPDVFVRTWHSQEDVERAHLSTAHVVVKVEAASLLVKSSLEISAGHCLPCVEGNWLQCTCNVLKRIIFYNIMSSAS